MQNTDLRAQNPLKVRLTCPNTTLMSIKTTRSLLDDMLVTLSYNQHAYPLPRVEKKQ